jgi:ferredoxin-thioredoxin reductase catalytic subunit
LQPESDTVEQEILEKSRQHAKTAGLSLNPDKKQLELMIKALAANKKLHGKAYCPCRALTGEPVQDTQIICPCSYHWEEVKKDGHCKCRLFWKKEK